MYLSSNVFQCIQPWFSILYLLAHLISTSAFEIYTIISHILHKDNEAERA